jgi:hypothetical protein
MNEILSIVSLMSLSISRDEVLSIKGSAVFWISIITISAWVTFIIEDSVIIFASVNSGSSPGTALSLSSTSYPSRKLLPLRQSNLAVPAAQITGSDWHGTISSILFFKIKLIKLY